MSAGSRSSPIEGLPEVGAGDALGELIAERWRDGGHRARAGDVVVVSQKVVSKAEGRVRDLATSSRASAPPSWPTQLGKDPRLVELVLGESQRGGPRRAPVC